MKKIISIILIILISSAIFAQSPEKRKATPEQLKKSLTLMMTDTIKREKVLLTEKLKLTEKQQNQTDKIINNILKKYDKQINKYVDTLVSYIVEKDKDPNSPKLKKIKEDLNKQEGIKHTLSKEFRSETKKILNSSQKKTFEEYVKQKEIEYNKRLNQTKK